MNIPEYIKITNEDNMELMARYEDNYFDLAIVDPPYGIEVNVNMGRRKGDKKSEYHKFHGLDKSIPAADYWDSLFHVSANQIVWGGNYMTEYLKPSACWFFWDKGFSADVTFAQFEMAWTSFSSSAKKFEYNAAKNNNRIHPTQKPVALYVWLLQNYASPGDKILDTHLGSGSIAIAVDQVNKLEGMNLTLTACELDKDYYEAAIKRISEQTKWQPTFKPEPQKVEQQELNLE